MIPLPRWLAAMLCTLLFGVAMACMPRAASAADEQDSCCCCAERCHCGEAQPGHRGDTRPACGCKAPPSAPHAPVAPLPQAQPTLPAPVAAEPVAETTFVLPRCGPRTTACPRAPPRGDRDVCQGRRRHEVLSVRRL